MSNVPKLLKENLLNTNETCFHKTQIRFSLAIILTISSWAGDPGSNGSIDKKNPMRDVTNTLREVMIERRFYTLVNFIRSLPVNMIYKRATARSGNYMVFKKVKGLKCYEILNQN